MVLPPKHQSLVPAPNAATSLHHKLVRSSTSSLLSARWNPTSASGAKDHWLEWNNQEHEKFQKYQEVVQQKRMQIAGKRGEEAAKRSFKQIRMEIEQDYPHLAPSSIPPNFDANPILGVPHPRAARTFPN